MLLEVDMPVEKFNAAVKDGTVGTKIESILEDAHPEAVYFCPTNGRRGGLFVVDVESPSDIVRLAEPWLLLFDARIQWRVLMTPDDLEQAGLAELGMKWAKGRLTWAAPSHSRGLLARRRAGQ
jgi:hypothetical protein